MALLGSVTIDGMVVGFWWHGGWLCRISDKIDFRPELAVCDEFLMESMNYFAADSARDVSEKYRKS